MQSFAFNCHDLERKYGDLRQFIVSEEAQILDLKQVVLNPFVYLIFFFMNKIWSNLFLQLKN